MKKNKSKNKSTNKSTNKKIKKIKKIKKMAERGSADLLRFEITTDPAMSIIDYDTLLAKSVLLGSRIDRRLQEAERLLMHCRFYTADSDLDVEIQRFLQDNDVE